MPPWLAQKLQFWSRGMGSADQTGEGDFQTMEINDTLRRMPPVLPVVGGSQNKCLFIGIKLLSNSIPLAILSGYNLT